MISRNHYINQVKIGLEEYPIVALIGARQIGKTTLARQFLNSDSDHYFDLEDPITESLMENPKAVLENLKGLVIIDEAQRQPKLFPVLRVLADREKFSAKFLILGSASPSLIRQSTETLAGRVHIIEMHGFSLKELATTDLQALWMRGSFPRSFLAKTDDSSEQWRKDFIRIYLERDLSALGFNMSPAMMRRFWLMVSHFNGQIWNASSVAKSMGIAVNTARSYLDALEQTFMVRQLLPWFSNTKKRLVKTPKLYFRDSGIFHTLSNIKSHKELMTHPSLGQSWEAFALEQSFRLLNIDHAYFYASHSGMELDLYIPERNLGIEFKFSDVPNVTKSMETAIDDLNLKQLYVVYPGSSKTQLRDDITLMPLSGLIS